VSRSTGAIDRRTALLGLVALLLSGAVFGATAAAGVSGIALDRDIYRVGVAPDSPYHEPVAQSTALAARPPSERLAPDGNLDLVVRDGEFAVADTQKGEAALAEFRGAVESYNDRRLAGEANQSAAFPVFVDLQYVARDEGFGGGSSDEPLGDVDGSTESETDGGEAGDDARPGGGVGSTNTEGSGSDGGSDTGGASDGSTADGSPTSDDLPVPEVGTGGNGLFGGQTSGSPAAISPPFPFASLILAFVFLVPMNFVIQAYGSTVLNERINRRGELLLVAPVGPGDIVAGKTVPYVAGMLLVTVVIALGVGGGVVSVLSVFPVALLFLAATFVGAMFARSFKELTFVTVAVSVFLTSYVFVPAIFTNVTPIALISPLTLVVRDLQGVGVSLLQYGFSTGPFYLGASVLFLLGLGVYREEDMFTQRPVPLKFLDALDSQIRGKWSMATLSALFIPFVFIAELLAVAILFALPIAVSTPLLLVTIAGVEEVAKSVHVYAGFEKARFSRTLRSALVLGTLSGFGFFVGEKLFAVVQLIGFGDLALGQQLLTSAGVGTDVDPLVALGLLFAPLVLHTVTTSISALGATRDPWSYAATVGVATLLHAAYNLTVVSSLV
jgi:ABC-type Na+ efflux pump permease subunit